MSELLLVTRSCWLVPIHVGTNHLGSTTDSNATAPANGHGVTHRGTPFHRSEGTPHKRRHRRFTSEKPLHSKHHQKLTHAGYQDVTRRAQEQCCHVSSSRASFLASRQLCVQSLLRAFTTPVQKTCLHRSTCCHASTPGAWILQQLFMWRHKGTLRGAERHRYASWSCASPPSSCVRSTRDDRMDIVRVALFLFCFGCWWNYCHSAAHRLAHPPTPQGFSRPTAVVVPLRSCL